MHSHSAERYVNTKMEKELQAYKLEIEKRFMKSEIKDYIFPIRTESESNEQRQNEPLSRNDKFSKHFQSA